METDYQGAGTIEANADGGASIALTENGDGTWWLDIHVAGQMIFTNHWTAADCEITPGGEQESPQILGCDDTANSIGNSATSTTTGRESLDGKTIGFSCTNHFSEPYSLGDVTGQDELTLSVNGTLTLTRRAEP
jgi:hypothetical protein